VQLPWSNCGVVKGEVQLEKAPEPKQLTEHWNVTGDASVLEKENVAVFDVTT
jgi:hypothetical protein